MAALPDKAAVAVAHWLDMPGKISFIIPVLNESSVIHGTLQHLQKIRSAGHEVIAVDGGSDDDTAILAAPLVDQLIHSPRGRANQMNAGAVAASGDILCFLHADTLLPVGAENDIVNGMTKLGKTWGRFDVRLSGKSLGLRLIAFMMNLRSRITGIATGDQAIFVSKESFVDVGGFPQIPLMEDIALCQKLRAISTPLCLRQQVITSSRRWEHNGIIKTVLLMWWLRLAYSLGADPGNLATTYGRQKCR